MKNDAPIGKNRTGIELSPIDKRSMLEDTELTHPSTESDGAVLAAARAEYYALPDVIGSVPPPASVKGMAKTGLEALKGVNAAVLIDKLGERLAFERTGSRLYETLIEKCAAEGELPGGPTVPDLQDIHAEEVRHFELVRDAIESLGADPTTMTPSADIVAVQSLGLVKVVSDARTTVKQSLEAMLTAELVDNDGWALLIELTRTAGRDELVPQFEEARAREIEHLAKVRRWVQAATLALEKPATRVTA
jgi:hypothetical protein